MDDLIRQVIAVLRGMWHRRWVGLAFAWVVGIAAAGWVLRTPDKYESSARIFVDTQSVLKPLMAGLAVQPNVEQQVAMLSRTLISRPNVEKLIRMADLDINAKTPTEREALIEGLTKTLDISRASYGENLYRISYRDTDKARANRVVQSLVSIFVESSLGGKRTDTDSAKRFIEEQIKVYERKLEEGENRLKEFKLRNITLASADGKDYTGRMSEGRAMLAQAKLDLREAENSRDALKRQVAGEEPMLLPDEPQQTSVSAPAVPEIDARLDTLRKNLDAMRLRYTDEHPDITGIKRVIADLEQQRKQELAARQRPAAAGGPRLASKANTNPVYQQLKVSLAEAEANVASLTTRVAEYESRVNALKESARMVPQIEAEYTQLNRDYEINRRNYEQLVARRESAEISGDMEAASGVADFRVIDPPRVSQQPVAPNRLLLLPVAFLAAIGAGLGASFLTSQIWPAVFDAHSLRMLTGLPVIGSVSMLPNDKRRRKHRRGLIGFIAAFGALLGAYGTGLLLLVMHTARAG